MSPLGRRRRPFLPQLNSTASKLAVALVAGSVLCALAPDGVRALLLLEPGRVIGQLALWQPLTYAFIERDPLGVIFGALILWSIGGSLETTWGSRRVLAFSVGSTVLAGAVTALLALVVYPLVGMAYAGGKVMTVALWVAYGLLLGPRQSNFWGLPVSGNILALIGVGFVFLNGAYGSWYAVVPDGLGILFAFLYVRRLTPRMGWLKVRAWWIEHRLRSRAKHLKVISKERNTPSDSDRYLH